jgi:hypothetical protein
MYNNMETLNPPKYKKFLLKQIKEKVGNKCTTQKCWAEQSFIRKMKSKAAEDLRKYTFRPEGPEGKFEWLNTFNIDDVMKQYEKKFNDFKFMGTVPMDFDDLPQYKLRTLDTEQLMREGKKKIGVVFNLDESWKSGSHWVAMYSDLEKGDILYFDSYGIAPEPRVRTLMRRIAKGISNRLPKDKIRADHNRLRHQYKNSECGVYSINFIIRMLNGDTFEDVNTNRISDDKINRCRKEYFSNVN